MIQASVAEGMHFALVQDAREVLREAIDRDGAKGQVIFILDLDEQLPFEIAAMYLSEFKAGARRRGSMLILVSTLAGAVYALRAPMHSGDRGHFVELERRALSRELLVSGEHLCVTLAGRGLSAWTIRPELPS